jgi:hypothetical protein
VVPNSPVLPMLGGFQLPIWISILVHNNPILNLNPKTQAKKRLTIYNTSNGKITLKKHVIVDRFIIFLKIKEEVDNPLRKEEKQLAKKKPNIFNSSISSFFCYKGTFQEI